MPTAQPITDEPAKRLEKVRRVFKKESLLSAQERKVKPHQQRRQNT
jgi:hypothetical protein